MDNGLIKGKLESHKEHLTTVTKWDEYAKAHSLPPSVTLIKNFGSWNAVKSALNIPTTIVSYNEEELKEIAKKHKKYMNSKSVWDAYYKEQGLPSSSTFIKHFGQWSKIKALVGYDTDRPKSDKYKKEDILGVLKKHAKNFQNRTQWDEYAKENQLPTYKTIKKHFEYDEILRIINKRKTFNFTKEDLLQIVRKNEEVFFTSSMNKWNEYASENNLPSSHVFLRKFGSWKKAKNELRIRL